MAEIFFATGFHAVASAGDVERWASGISGSSPSLLADLADADGQTLRVAPSSWVTLPLRGDPGTSWVLHFWWRTNNLSQLETSHSIVGLTDATGTIVGINLRPHSSGFSVRNGGTQIAVASIADKTSAAHYRLVVEEHASTGSVKLYQGETLLVDESNVDTSRGSTVDRLHLEDHGGNLDRDSQFAHIVLTDEDLGSGALVGYVPVSSDQTPNDFTKSDAGLDHFEHLDEEPNDGDTSYLLSPNTGEGDQTKHRASLSLPNRRIVAARAFLVARLEAAGGDRLGVTYESGAASPVEHTLEDFETDYTPKGGDWLSEDPDTSEEWTDSGLSAADITVEHLAPEA